MDTRVSLLATLDALIQGVLWAVLCFVVISRFNLASVWFFVCGIVLLVEIGLLVLHQRITFPGLVRYLGYEPNEKLEETKRFRVTDHVVQIGVMYGVVYWCLRT